MPFKQTEVDFIGAWYVKTTDRNKRCKFTCSLVRLLEQYILKSLTISQKKHSFKAFAVSQTESHCSEWIETAIRVTPFKATIRQSRSGMGIYPQDGSLHGTGDLGTIKRNDEDNYKEGRWTSKNRSYQHSETRDGSWSSTWRSTTHVCNVRPTGCRALDAITFNLWQKSHLTPLPDNGRRGNQWPRIRRRANGEEKI